jgi:hypothetical protein
MATDCSNVVTELFAIAVFVISMYAELHHQREENQEKTHPLSVLK